MDFKEYQEAFKTQLSEYGICYIEIKKYKKTKALFISPLGVGFRITGLDSEVLEPLFIEKLDNEIIQFRIKTILCSLFNCENFSICENSIKRHPDTLFSCLLFRNDKSIVYIIEDLSSLIKRVNYLPTSLNLHVYYRGELVKWNPIPSLFRNKQHLINEVINDEKIISLLPEEFSNCHTDFDKLVKLKHYSEPSRLLDLTKSPLVALFFALENMKQYGSDGLIRVCFSNKETEKIATISDTVALLTGLAKTNLKKCNIVSSNSSDLDCSKCDKCVKNDCDYMKELQYRVQKITGVDYNWGDASDDRKKSISDDLNKCIVVHPPYNNYRIIQQQGLFILCGRNKNDIYNYPKQLLSFWTNPKTKKNYYFYIPVSRLDVLFDELESLGINKHYIYGNLENEIKSLIRES